MTIKIEVDGVEEIIGKLTVEKLMKLKSVFREEVLRLEKEIKETSPVDTGRYRSAWHTTIKGYEAEITNNVEYAPHLIFGTQRFRNVKNPSKYRKADLERGILHDVRAILHEWETRFRRRLGGLIK